MIVYHGSFMEIPKPDIVHSRKNVDFGQGFYVTPIYEQARKWSEKFKKRSRQAFVSRYFFDERAYLKESTLIFDSYSEEWLDFIVNCRSGEDISDYVIVVGGVANDKVFNTVELALDGLIDKTEALRRLRYEKPNLQISFRSQFVIDQYLKFEGSEVL